MIIDPTPGRVLWYYPGGREEFDAGAPACAAMIAFVNPLLAGDTQQTVNLNYLQYSGIPSAVTDVPLWQNEEGSEAPESPFCMWMPFQKGQAAAAAQTTASGAPSVEVPAIVGQHHILNIAEAVALNEVLSSAG
jgi:hypothetical protein